MQEDRGLRRVIAALAAIAVVAGTALAGGAGAQGGSLDEGVTFTPQITFGTDAAPNGLAPFPGDAAVDSDGNVWVVDAANNRVMKYTFSGEFITAVGSPTVTDPRGIGADNAGFVYIVDRDVTGARVVRLTNGAEAAGTIGGPAGGPGFLGSPDDVAVSADGIVYVTDGNVERFSTSGAPLAPLPGVIAGGFIAVAPDGTVYTVNATDIERHTPAGAAAGAPIPLSPTFTGTPTGLASDRNGGVYVGLVGEGEVAHYATNGALLDRVGKLSDEANTPFLFTISGIAVDCRRNLYVTQTKATGSPPTNVAEVVKVGDSQAKPPPCTPPALVPGGPVDVQVNDVEVTQAIQPGNDYTAVVDPVIGSRGRTFGDGTGEVRMLTGRKTVVRVFATLRTGPPGGIANIPATLTARPTGGGAFRTTEIGPEAGPALLRVGTNQVTRAQQLDPAGAYTFVLPDEWTRHFGKIDLTATVNPTGVGCDEGCRQRSTFRLSGVPFQDSLTPSFTAVFSPEGVRVIPIALTQGGAFPAQAGGRPLTDSPLPAFRYGRVLLPIDMQVEGWGGTIEIGDLTASSLKIESCLFGIDLGILCDEDDLSEGSAEARERLQGILFDRIEDWMDDRGIRNNTIVIGLKSGGRGDLPGASQPTNVKRGRSEDDVPYGYADIANERRNSPIHEIMHMFGRRHASGCNGANANGQVADPWPPDEKGYLQGIGLNPLPGSGGGSGPYEIVAAGTKVNPGEAYDVMSYCRGSKDTWISPRGWNALLDFVPQGLRTPSPARAAQAAGPVLRVTAIESSTGKLIITGTSPETGRASTADPSSPYSVEARDASGAVLASVPAAAAPLEGPAKILTATVPRPAGTAQVVVRRGTETATRVQKSANAPKVSLLAPATGFRVRGKQLAVRWRATDADGGTLGATIEYSANGGRSWKSAFAGPASLGRRSIAVGQLTPSKRARLRVRVDDGFNETIATSGTFTVDGVPPVVTISEPINRQRVRADAPLTLRGEATGAGGAPLSAKGLRWYDGRKLIGRGGALFVESFLPGTHRIRLTATQGGRVGTATAVLRVTGVKPAFLRLDAPATLAPAARTVKLSVASSVASTLQIGGKRFTVGRKAKSIMVAVRPGATPLKLILKLRAGRQSASQTLTIPRS